MTKQALIKEFEKEFDWDIIVSEAHPELKAFILKAYDAGRSEEREHIKKFIQERIEVSDIMLDAAYKGDNLGDGWTREERINHETSAKSVLEELIFQLTKDV